MHFNRLYHSTFIKKLRKKHFLILGLSKRTGWKMVQFFSDLNIPYSVSDLSISFQCFQALKKLNKPPMRIFSGFQTPSQLENISDIVTAPGVPKDIPIILQAKKKALKVWCDFDLLYPLYKDKTIIAVTGTDGKSTTVSFISHLISPFFKTLLCGNIGNTISGYFKEFHRYDVIVIEMSSYMLENIYQFRANISTILNLAEDHIDRHKNLLNYINSKYNIIRYSQKNDFFLKNIDNPITKKRTFSLNTSITELTFSNEKSSLNNRNIDYYYDKNTDTFIGKHLSLKNPKKKMNCNIHNTSILFALAVLEYLNLSIKTCKKYFYSFNPLPHRLEKVDLSFNRKLTIYNDSKATTPQAVSSALENLKGNITLILGGKDKNLSFKILKPYLNKVNQLFIYGEARNKIANQLKDFPVINIEEDFKTIVKNAWQSTNPEEILVLSPGCSSFDQFSNFEKRGDFFKELVLQLDKNVL